MTTRSEVVAVARGWLDTPFKHQGRLPGVVLDCVGVSICLARHFGWPHEDARDYARRPSKEGLLERLLLYLDFAPATKPGNTIVFDMIGTEDEKIWPMHVALRTERGMLHAYSRARRSGDPRAGFVVEQPIDGVWQRRIVAELQFRGLED